MADKIVACSERAMSADFVAEFTGTHSSAWTCNQDFEGDGGASRQRVNGLGSGILEWQLKGLLTIPMRENPYRRDHHIA
jgi:hypothetical protein